MLGSKVCVGKVCVFMKADIQSIWYVHVCMPACREQLAFELLRRACERFEATPELGSALVLHVQLLLQRSKELLAKQKIEEVITGAAHLYSI